MKAIKNMANEKAPGQSKLTTDMIKNLPQEATNLYFEIIQEFWTNNEVDLKAWHTTMLNTIYKGKGDPQEPNNHRGIALKETSAKVLSIVIGQRLLKRFKQINPISQFGHRKRNTPLKKPYSSGNNTGLSHTASS